PSTAEYRARAPASEMAPRRSRYPTKRKKRNRVLVSLASQVHQVPQIGFAQSGPVVSITQANAVPTSADAAANRSYRSSFINKYRMLARPTRPNASIVDHAAGTWT